MKVVYTFLLLLTASEILCLNTRWWKNAAIYEIYLRSFKDSDGDGIGDIGGLISKLDYLVDIGVDTIYLAPFYPSSGDDGGYDIVNYTDIDPVYGTLKDFRELIKELKARGLFLLIDLVINHSSDEHEWFQKSVDKIEPYTDFYTWVNPKDYDWSGNPIPPNNWFSVFTFGVEGSAWTWNEKRKQFYLHQCNVKQPDLNLRNAKVKGEIKSLIKFWLDEGVTGFRVDAPMIFMEDENLSDFHFNSDRTIFNVFQDSGPTYNHPDTYKFINELHTYLKQYDRESGKPTQSVLIGETYGSIKSVIQYYGTKDFPVFHLPFNFHLTMLDKYLDARGMRDYLYMWLNGVPKDMPSNWALGNHDAGRIARKFDMEYNSILLALVAMLPGTSTIYYGEELSMGENHLSDIKDAFNRISHRTPMHWDDTRNAGFTSAEKPWLPVHPSYWHVNALTQKLNSNSTLNYFKDLMTLKRTDTVKYGKLGIHTISKWMLAIIRTYKRSTYIVVMNLGTETNPVDLQVTFNNLPGTLTVATSSPNSGYTKGFEIKTTPNYPNSLVLRPHSVLILRSGRSK